MFLLLFCKITETAWNSRFCMYFWLRDFSYWDPKATTSLKDWRKTENVFLLCDKCHVLKNCNKIIVQKKKRKKEGLKDYFILDGWWDYGPSKVVSSLSKHVHHEIHRTSIDLVENAVPSLAGCMAKEHSWLQSFIQASEEVGEMANCWWRTKRYNANKQ